MKKGYDYEKKQCWRSFKYHTLPMTMHYITTILTLFFAGIGFIRSSLEWNMDTTLITLLCIALVFGTVIFAAVAKTLEQDNYRANIIDAIKDNIDNCETLSLTDEQKERLKLIATKNI